MKSGTCLRRWRDELNRKERRDRKALLFLEIGNWFLIFVFFAFFAVKNFRNLWLVFCQ
jgi:hypothetical protein